MTGNQSYGRGIMKKPKTPNSPRLSECWTIPKAAEHLGIPRSTRASAIKAGTLKTHKSGCGREMVRLSDCKPWGRE